MSAKSGEVGDFRESGRACSVDPAWEDFKITAICGHLDPSKNLNLHAESLSDMAVLAETAGDNHIVI